MPKQINTEDAINDLYALCVLQAAQIVVLKAAFLNFAKMYDPEFYKVLEQRFDELVETNVQAQLDKNPNLSEIVSDVVKQLLKNEPRKY